MGGTARRGLNHCKNQGEFLAAAKKRRHPGRNGEAVERRDPGDLSLRFSLYINWMKAHLRLIAWVPALRFATAGMTKK